MDKPFAITLDPGSSLANKTVPGAPSARSTSTACRRATRSARRAKTSRAGCTTPKSGDYEAAWRHLVRDNPFPAIMGRVCYHSVRRRATAASSTRRWASTRSSASWATRR
jgi:hypothetical protein